MRRLLVWIGGLLVLAFVALAAVAGVARFLDGPLGPFPGGPLSGEVVEPVPGDWSFAAGADTIELEVQPDDPRSLHTWVVVREGDLFVPSGFAERKSWPEDVLADPRVTLRIDGKLYEVALGRVEDAEARQALLAALAEKYGTLPGGAEGTWFFRVEPRRSHHSAG